MVTCVGRERCGHLCREGEVWSPMSQGLCNRLPVWDKGVWLPAR